MTALSTILTVVPLAFAILLVLAVALDPPRSTLPKARVVTRTRVTAR